MKKKKNEASTQCHGGAKEDSRAYTILAAWVTYSSEYLTRKPMEGKALPQFYNFTSRRVREVKKSQHNGVNPMAKYRSMGLRWIIQ